MNVLRRPVENRIRKQAFSHLARTDGNSMQLSKRLADLSLSLALVFLVVGIFYFETRATPTSSSENISLTLFGAWAVAILSLCALSLLSRAYYVLRNKPRELLYHLYPSILALLPFVFYWKTI